MLDVPNPHGERVPQLRTVRGVLTYHEDRVRVERALRDDPLGQMHARRQISDAQYRAGREWQRYAEAAGTPLRSSGDLQEPVDGSPRHRAGVTDAQLRAIRRRELWRDMLGGKGFLLCDAVLEDKASIREASMLLWYEDNPPMVRYVGRRFRECLDALAADLGLTT